MKIAVCYESILGGESVATKVIIQELKKLPHVDVVAQQFPPIVYTDSLRFFCWTFGSIGRWMKFIWVHRYVDWIYTTTFTAAVASAFLKPFFSFRIAWHVHGSRIPPSPVGLRGKTYVTQWMKHSITYWLHVCMLRIIDCVLVPSIESKKQLFFTFPNLQKEHVRVIPNGVDKKKFHPVVVKTRSVLRKRFGIKAGQKVVLYVGRLQKQKNLETLLNVMKELLLVDRSVMLVVAHFSPVLSEEQEYKKSLQKRVKDLHISRSVIWVDDMSSIEYIYHIADLVVSLSQNETFSLTLLESMASGVLFMGTDVGEASSILPRVSSRLVIRAGDSIESVAKKICAVFYLPLREHRKMQKKVMHIVAPYTWENTATRIQKVFNDFPRRTL